MDFLQELERKVKQIEELIKKYMPSCADSDETKTIYQAMEYSLMAGGKRLRPMLMAEVYSLFQTTGKEEILERFMVAIEMIHTYSLVHDDLPAMDNDEYRRGRKTTHIVYGEAMGVLAGDALLNSAFELAAECFDTKLLLRDGMSEKEQLETVSQVAKALQILAKKAGIKGMIGGQVMDIEAEGNCLELSVLNRLNALKTGALLEASMMIGAVLAGADDEQTAVIEEAARDIGLAFQIQDDILDVTGKAEELGKPVHSDEKNHKNTYVALYGVDKAKKQVESYSAHACDILNKLPVSNAFLSELILYLTDRKN